MEVRKRYKQTEVGVIPEDWDVKLIGNLAEKVMVGIASAATHAYRPQGIPLLRNQNIKKNYLQDDDLLFIDEQYELIYKNKRLKTGDLLTARTGYPGTTCIIPPKYDGAQCFTTIITRLKKNEINSDYLCHYINSEYGISFIEKSKIGGGQKNIGVGIFQVMPIPIPTSAEQEVIAEALSDADALIESLETLLAKKRQVKQGAMSELLTGKRRVVKSGEWAEKKLSDICWYQEGPGVRTWQFTKSGIKLLNGTNIFRGEINLDNTDRFISENLAYGQYAHFMADSGDIVIASSGITVEKFEEKVAFVRDEHLPLCMNTSTIRFKANKNVLQSSFLYFLLMSDLFKKQIGHQATGSAQLNFGPAHLNKVLFKLPDLSEQTAIAEILSDMDAEIRAVEEKLSKARAVKAGMMSALLTGRVRLVK